MGHDKTRRPRPALNTRALDELAMSYVGRFATTRAKLREYLARKLRERGWDGAAMPDVQEIADRFAARGFVDDGAFALAKARTLSGRGYGTRRLVQTLRTAGVGDDDATPALREADDHAVDSILRFAQRRRIGPFAATLPDPKARDRAFAALVRAGHGFALARSVVNLAPGEEPDRDLLQEHCPTAND
jgi:regulatory protein